MKLFDKAILKLTALYTAVLLIICISFSAAIYGSANRALFRPRPTEIEIIRPDHTVELEKALRIRSEQINSDILARLILVNLAVLAAGAVASYFLARLTLKPINEAMDAQGRFVSDASHELRTPLAVIAMENEIILRDRNAKREELHAQIKSNLEEVGKLRELTDRLLSLSQNEPLKLTNIDVKEAAEASLKRVQNSAKSKKITLQTQIESRKIQANLGALADILAILLDNAIKYSPEKSTILIGQTDEKLFVRDQGFGIASVDLPHIFDRFYRAETNRTSNGYGLGLPLAQNIADQMNMKITVKNNPDTGTTFFVG